MGEMLLLYTIVLFFAAYIIKLMWVIGVMLYQWLGMKLMDISEWSKDIHG